MIDVKTQKPRTYVLLRIKYSKISWELYYILRLDDDCEHVELLAFWGPNMSLCGPILGSCFTFLGTKSGQEPNQSDCDTIFVDFWGVSKRIDVWRVAGAPNKRSMCALGRKWDDKNATAPAKRSSGSPSWDLGSLGTPRARQGLIIKSIKDWLNKD